MPDLDIAFAASRTDMRALPLAPAVDLDRLFRDGSPFAPALRDQIVGIDAVLDEVDAIVDVLVRFADYTAHGVRPEPGVLLVGAPGTGKTLVSRYVATAARALLVDVREAAAGDGRPSAGDVAELFRCARSTHARTGRPVVLFWDEFDGMCREGHHGPTRHESTVAQLLAELDGLRGKNDGVLLLACCNDAEGVDDALLRSGRIGLRLDLVAPDLGGKEALLDHYVGDKAVTEPLDLASLADLFSPGDTAAAVEEAVEEAWRRSVAAALRTGCAPALSPTTLAAVIVDRAIGRLTGEVVAGASLTRVAVHEVGHALVAHALGIPVRAVCVRSRGDARGVVATGNPADDQCLATQLAHLRVAYGGMAAEQVAGLGHGVGYGSDTARATQLAAMLVTREGVGRRLAAFNPDGLSCRQSWLQTEPAEATARRRDLDIADLLAEAAADARRLLADAGAGAIVALAEELIEAGTLHGKALERRLDSVVRTGGGGADSV